MIPWPPYLYRTFGLTIASELELPELPSTDGMPDVVVRMGRVPSVPDTPELRHGLSYICGGAWLVAAEREAGARFLILDGREIIVESVAPGSDDALRLVLLGTCMGAVLVQRGLLPLHANAVVKDGAVLIGGAIGAGKSTLTAALVGCGYQLLADDISAVRLEPGHAPVIDPGYGQVKLWSTSLERLGIDTRRVSRLRPEIPKYRVPLDDAFCDRSQVLRAIYLLKPALVERPVLREVVGMQKLRELQSHLYKLELSDAQPLFPWLFPVLAAVAAHAPAYIVERPVHDFQIEQLADLVASSLQSSPV